MGDLATLRARKILEKLKTSFLRNTQDKKNTRASSRFFLSFVSLEKLRFS